jgi:hypothetical protein
MTDQRRPNKRQIPVMKAMVVNDKLPSPHRHNTCHTATLLARAKGGQLSAYILGGGKGHSFCRNGETYEPLVIGTEQVDTTRA